jgi:hypothetical protein
LEGESKQEEGDTMTVHNLNPHATALLIALYRNSTSQNLVPLTETSPDQVGRMYLIGPWHFPPAILSLNRDLRDEDRWYEAFTYLRTHSFIRHDVGNVWKLAGPGWSYVDGLRELGKKAPDGTLLWDSINTCLDRLKLAQAGQQGGSPVTGSDGDVNSLTLRLIDLCGEYRKN